MRLPWRSRERKQQTGSQQKQTRTGRVAGALVTASLAFGTACGPTGVSSQSAAISDNSVANHPGALQAQVVATGIPGAGAITQVGGFNIGSPFGPGGPFVPFTQPGKVAHRKRLFVASSSNFGAPLGRADESAGTVLSIDPTSGPVGVPSGFAAAGGQAQAAGGRVMVYSANNGAFFNDYNTAAGAPAVTKTEVAASLPTGISINSGNGRPWYSNAPLGAAGDGTITVIDPDGKPLKGGPSPVAGGVFKGDITNRYANTHGLSSAALGTALLTKSSDQSNRAVFASVEADGSVVQIHVQKGVEALAPAGTVTPLATVDAAAMESTDPATTTRKGIVFNWVPTENLFIADPAANRLVVLDLTHDAGPNAHFSATSRTITSPGFNMPIDLAPTAREVSNANFASNTTLGGGSDIYVLNRGDNSIARIAIDGTLIAVRTIDAPVADFRVNGIAVSEDGQHIYVTATLPGADGVVLEVPAFGAGDITAGIFAQAMADGSNEMMGIGKNVFMMNFSPEQGMGPLFNGQGCNSCHDNPGPGGMGTLPTQQEFVIGRLAPDGSFDSTFGQSGMVSRNHSIAELGASCGLPTGVPPEATIASKRNTMTLLGNGLLDTIEPEFILANVAAEPAAVRGRVNLLADGRIGKFGWKANVATVVEFMADAFRNEMGMTNPMVPEDEVNGCGANQNHREVEGLSLQATAAFLNTLDPPLNTLTSCQTGASTSAGWLQFTTLGCNGCHTPSLRGRGTNVPLYSDLALHDMGPGLADGMQQGSSTGSEWRTMPIWRVSQRSKFLHDGRASSIEDAILAHGGQAQAARDGFAGLDATAKAALLAFLGCI